MTRDPRCLSDPGITPSSLFRFDMKFCVLWASSVRAGQLAIYWWGADLLRRIVPKWVQQTPLRGVVVELAVGVR